MHRRPATISRGSSSMLGFEHPKSTDYFGSENIPASKWFDGLGLRVILRQILESEFDGFERLQLTIFL
jgi:hypothetical protein